jgi:hypothetical protein
MSRPRLAWLTLLPIAALSLAACGSSAGGGSGPTADQAAASVGATVTPSPSPSPTCKQQADAWKKTNAGLIRRFEHALTPFSARTVTTNRLASTAKAMEVAAVPVCTDPHGYYVQAMANLETAGESASGGGALAELGAMTPLENALTALNEFQAELEANAGLHKL